MHHRFNVGDQAVVQYRSLGLDELAHPWAPRTKGYWRTRNGQQVIIERSYEDGKVYAIKDENLLCDVHWLRVPPMRLGSLLGMYRAQ